MIATGLSLLKVLSHIFVGSTLSDLADLVPGTNDNHDQNNKEEWNNLSLQTIIKIATASITTVIAVGGSFYVWYLVKKEMKNTLGSVDPENMNEPLNRLSTSSQETIDTLSATDEPLNSEKHPEPLNSPSFFLIPEQHLNIEDSKPTK